MEYSQNFFSFFLAFTNMEIFLPAYQEMYWPHLMKANMQKKKKKKEVEAH